MIRLRCLEILAEYVTGEVVICAIGPSTEEWHHVAPRPLNFYTSGMGTTGSVGLGVALACPERTVLVLHGDGGLLMGLGSLATASAADPPNLRHLVFVNRIYESSGGQPLVNAAAIDFATAAKGMGVRHVREFRDEKDFQREVSQLFFDSGHAFWVLHVEDSPSSLLPAPKDNRRLKEEFIRAITGVLP
jgi:phosphonopyruvate decarboxylase